MQFMELLAHLKAVAHAQEREIYLVGGCVRDGLLGRPLIDVDLAIAGDDAEGAVARALALRLNGAYVPLGERFGTARVALPRDDGGVIQVDCTEFTGTLRDDLLRRDFTIDAMAVDVADFGGAVAWAQADIIDPCNGRHDLETGLLRLVSPDALDADPLRLLRAVRLAAEMGLTIDPKTQVEIRERARLLAAAAPERQRDELCKILAAPGAAFWLLLMDDLGLLAVLLPELVEGRGVEQPKEHHWDVFRHQMEAVAAAEAMVERHLPVLLQDREYLQPGLNHIPWHPGMEGYFDNEVGGLPRKVLLKLAALLHDIGKPASKTFEPNGRMRFFGHAELGAEMVEKMLRRLRFSNQGIEAIARMVDNHLRPGQWSDTGMPTARALFRYFRDVGNVAVDTIYLNLADHLAARGPMFDEVRWQEHVAVANAALAYYFDQRLWHAAMPRLVTGNDLMEALHLQPGPVVGRLLAEVDEAAAVGAVATKEEALILAVRWLAADETPSKCR